MVSIIRVAVAACGLLAASSAVQAKVNIHIDISTQRMHVSTDDGERYSWKVSTGRKGYNTPRGNFSPYLLKRMHYSRKYDNSPMPYSIFFRGGYAIHGTKSISRLGRPASHGCIRLAPRNARKLFGLVKRHGARITITGSRAEFYANRKSRKNRATRERPHLANHEAWRQQQILIAQRGRRATPDAGRMRGSAPVVDRFGTASIPQPATMGSVYFTTPGTIGRFSGRATYR